MRRSLLLRALIFLLLLSVACGIYKAESGKAGILEGEKALDFTLKDLKDEHISLSDFVGKKPILLDFNTSWCPYCISIIPTLKNIYKNYNGRGLEILSIYINEPKEIIETLAKKHEIPYTVLLDSDASLAATYEIAGVPTIIIVDKDGQIRYRGHTFPADVVEEMLK